MSIQVGSLVRFTLQRTCCPETGIHQFQYAPGMSAGIVVRYQGRGYPYCLVLVNGIIVEIDIDYLEEVYGP